MIGTIATSLVSGVFGLLTLLVGLLPSFSWPDLAGTLSATGVSQYVGYLNWFFPVGTALSITVAWATALLAYNAWLFFSGWLRLFIK